MLQPRCLAAKLLVLLAVWGWAPGAAAQPANGKSGPATSLTDDERARELYLRGDRLYSEGEYKGAIRAFEKAYELSKRPALLFNLANAYERLGRYEAALKALQDFLPTAGGRKKAVCKRIASLERRIEELSKDDGKPKSEPPPEPEPEPEPKPKPSPDPEPEGPQVIPIVGYVLLGLGAVGLGLGIGFAVDATSARDQAETLCPESAGLRLCPPEAQETIDRDTASSLAADISFGVGAAAAAAGLVMVLVSLGSGSDHEPEETARIWATPRIGGGEVGIVGTF